MADRESSKEEAPAEVARAAGLRYVHDDRPGVHRVRSGRSFRYVGPDGGAVRDPEVLDRIRRLAIPPAWTDVWICPLANGHIQATGRDARGRKQYRYHARWRETRDETKYHRMIAFGSALPAVRARVEADLALPGLPRDKVLAAVVRLLETTLIRVGNEEYARANGSFGLTTLRNRHVEVNGATVRFHFRGKSGVRHAVDVSDRRLARIIRRCQELPGHELFQYVDDDGVTHDDRVRRTSTTTCARSPATNSRPRTSAPGPAPSWRPRRCGPARRSTSAGEAQEERRRGHRGGGAAAGQHRRAFAASATSTRP